MNPTPSDKTELLPCAHCGSVAELLYQSPWFYVQCTKCGIRTNGMGENNKRGIVLDWNLRPKPYKPTSEPTTTEEPMKSHSKDCALAINARHGCTCGVEDKCREEFEKWFEKEFPIEKVEGSDFEAGLANSINTFRPVGKAYALKAWQASRKEMEEEIKFLETQLYDQGRRFDKVLDENERLKQEYERSEDAWKDSQELLLKAGCDLSSLREEYDRLKQELEAAETNANIWMEGYKHLQSIIEKKDEALKIIKEWAHPGLGKLINWDLRIEPILEAALQIGKSEVNPKEGEEI